MNPRRARVWREGAWTVYSPGWRGYVDLGSGLEHVRAELAKIAARHKSRAWHETRMRALGRSSSTAHRLVHRLMALGVIYVQPTLGRNGRTRFTFVVNFWRNRPIRRGQMARFHVKPSEGQIALPFADTGPPVEIARPFEKPPSGPTGSIDGLMRRFGINESLLVEWGRGR